MQRITGDCLEVMRTLPDNCVDAVVMDPPYCSGGFSETQKRHAKGQGLRSETLRKVGWFGSDAMTTGGLLCLLRSVAVESLRLMRGEGGSLLTFCDWRMAPMLAPALESAGYRYQNMIVWDKGSMGLGRGFRPRHELILHMVVGSPTFYAKDAGNVLAAKRVHHTRRVHQTEKPVDLLEELIRVVCPPGGVVLDPFAGSGSTARAAENIGRKAICIERAPDAR